MAWLRRASALVVWCCVVNVDAQEHADGGARATASGGSAAPLATLAAWSSAMSREDVRLGLPDADHDDAYLYRLPYARDVSFPIIQGYDSRLSHRGVERFTLDFGMPVGTDVHAARGGTVVLVEDSHEVGCAREECGRFANFVVVLHDDGTTGEYFHLAARSVVVERGATVVRGQRIARSGNTGFSTAPHLHFGVYRTAYDGRTESVAVRFATRVGAVVVPRSGGRYTNALDP